MWATLEYPIFQNIDISVQHSFRLRTYTLIDGYLKYVCFVLCLFKLWIRLIGCAYRKNKCFIIKHSTSILFFLSFKCLFSFFSISFCPFFSFVLFGYYLIMSIKRRELDRRTQFPVVNRNGCCKDDAV